MPRGSTVEVTDCLWYFWYCICKVTGQQELNNFNYVDPRCRICFFYIILGKWSDIQLLKIPTYYKFIALYKYEYIAAPIKFKITEILIVFH